MASRNNQTTYGIGCGPAIIGVLIGFWVAFTFNLAIVLCVAIGMGATVVAGIFYGILALIVRALN